MKLSYALICGAAIMIAAPAYAQSHDDRRTDQHEVTTVIHTRHIVSHSHRVVVHRTRYSRYSTPEERRETAELNRHGVQVHEPDGSEHDDQR